VKRTRLALLLLAFIAISSPCLTQSGAVKSRETDSRFLFEEGAIIRGDKTTKKLALVFTGDEFADGAETIVRILKRRDVKASFFFTGRFYRNAVFKSSIQKLKRDGHYLGAHSDQHPSLLRLEQA
jgi:peptidoglycan/xylan/chitin deacetylase (PgdA/CDA1 family)